MIQYCNFVITNFLCLHKKQPRNLRDYIPSNYVRVGNVAP